jgi:hypothetical protein
MSRDVDHPWLRPLWRRVLLVAFCALWAAFELATGSPTWALLVGGMALYGAWAFLVAYNPDPGPPADGDAGKE